MSLIAAAPRRQTATGGPGGAGLPTASQARQVLKSLAAASSSSTWATFATVQLSDFPGYDPTGGTDQRATIAAADAALQPMGGTIDFGPGLFLLSGIATCSNNVRWLGVKAVGWQGASNTANPTTGGTILKSSGTATPVRLGTDAGTTGPAGATIENLTVYAYNTGVTGVSVEGQKARLVNCIVYGGTNNGVATTTTGNGFRAIGTDVWMNLRGSAWFLGGNDAHIIASVTQGYLYGVNLANAGLYMTANHFFTASGAGTASNDIRITGTGAAQISGNTLENCLGDVVFIQPTAGTACLGITIDGNHTYSATASRPADTAGLYRLDATAAGASISTVHLGSCAASMTGVRDLYIVKATGNVTQWSMGSIHHSHAQHIFAPGSLTPDAGMGPCSVNTSATPGANVLRSANGGVTTPHFTGDNSTTEFPVNHGVDPGPGVGSKPLRYSVTPATIDAATAAANGFYANITATQVSIVFLTAPPVGADIAFTWEVKTA